MAGYNRNSILFFISLCAGTSLELLILVLQTFGTSPLLLSLRPIINGKIYTKSSRIQLKFKRLDNQQETSDKRAHCSIKHF